METYRWEVRVLVDDSSRLFLLGLCQGLAIFETATRWHRAPRGPPLSVALRIIDTSD
jgi:hypothetical protein